MKKRGRRAAVILGAIAAGVIAMDLISKGFLETRLRLGESILICDGPITFRIANVRNPGVAFGMLSGAALQWRMPFFFIVLITAGWFLWKLHKEEGSRPGVGIALGLIGGGAVGNLVDRIRYGEVVDFLDFHISSFHWPAFNIADTAICIGIGLMAFELVFKDHRMLTSGG